MTFQMITSHGRQDHWLGRKDVSMSALDPAVF